MKSTFLRFRTLLLLVLTLGAAMSTLAATRFHFALEKSSPADGATVHELSEVKLWFTQPPAEGTVSIRLIDAAGEMVPTSDPVQDPQDPKIFAVAPSEKVSAGTYGVSWRGMGGDGHVVRGDFSFNVMGH